MLLAVEVFVVERQWGVGRVPELSRAVMLLAMRRHKPDTYEWYRHFLESFCAASGTVKASDVRPLHVPRCPC